MKHADQVALALRDMNLGAEAIRHAALALNGRPGVSLPANFGYSATIAPLDRLARLLGVEEVQAPPKARSPRRKPRARRARPPRKVSAKAKADRSKELAEFVESHQTSAWDPEDSISDRQAEAGNCRALLLEVIRRASYDWVLYRNSSKLQNKLLAENAYHWLFLEHEGTPVWAQRDRNGKGMMSLIAICDALDIEPSEVRRRARELTEKDIMGAGRPAERRKTKQNEDAMSSDEHSAFGVDVDSLPYHDPMFVSEG